ncbi:MAG: hypothetical protein BWK73_52695 [Thiothrix lacustris]|uniref:Uncharacterized protein n=1 Tax=Thiothrix lacustris TaxID=525917 RepID=A0A1Y1Q7A9_9GAMM|nr:MAG: hypothetical protein BWK73_52695 [Thiothrix lacustris]
MKKILGLLFLSLLSGQLLAGTADMSEEGHEELVRQEKEAIKNIYKTDNTLESIAGAISSPVDSEFGGSWLDVNMTLDRIKEYNGERNEMKIRGIGIANIEIDGPNCCVGDAYVKFKRSQELEAKIIASLTSQFDPASEITSIMTCENDGSSMLSKDIFRLVLPGRQPMSFKINTNDEFIKFQFSASEDSLTCNSPETPPPVPKSSEFIIKGDV